MAVISDLVWYDDQHTSGHVYRTMIQEDDNNVVRIPVNTVADEVVIEGVTTFNGPCEFKGGLGQFAGAYVMNDEHNYANMHYVYMRTTCPYGPGAECNLKDPVDNLKTGGGAFTVILNVDPTNSFRVVPANFVAGNGSTATGVTLEIGEMVLLMWCHHEYRVINTTGTVE